MDMGMGIGVHPEARRLRREVREANGRLADVLLEIDDIELQQNPQIEADYAVKVGYLENDLLARQIDARRARRALELARARVNRGEALDSSALADIERQLDEEFAAWRRRLERALDRAQRLIDRRSSRVALSAEESRELKRLYRELTKRLHPDLNPGQGAREQALFGAARRLYENGDLAAMRALHATVLGWGDSENSLADDRLAELGLLDALRVELVAARGRIEAMEGRLAELKASEPYAWRERLADPAWIAARSEELHAEMAESERAASAYRSRLEALRREAA